MNDLEMDIEKNSDRIDDYSKVQQQKEIIISRLKQRGFRLTNQREIILDIILKNRCNSCKEIYYKAIKKEAQIGIATVYRLVNILEEIEAISRGDLYKIANLGIVQEIK